MNKRLVILSIVSEFHSFGAMSYLNFNNLVNDETDYLVIISFHKSSNSYRVNKKNFDLINNKNIKIIYKDNFIKSSNIIAKEIKYKKYEEVLVINVMDFDYINLFNLKFLYKIKKINSVIIDEGMGMYFTKEIWNKSIQCEKKFYYLNSKENYLDKIKNYSKFIIKIFVKYIVKKTSIKLEKFHLFTIKKGYLIENYSTIRAYKNFYDKMFKNGNSIKKYCDNSTTNIIIISDVLSSNLVHPDEEIEIYKKIILILTEKFSTSKILLKPHPNEMKNLEKFKKLKECIIIDEVISFDEFIYENNNIDLVVGLTSTCLLMAATLFNKNTVSFVDYVEVNSFTEIAKERIECLKERTKYIENFKYKF